MTCSVVGDDQKLAIAHKRSNDDFASRCPFVVQVWILNVALDLTFGIGNGDNGTNGSIGQDFQGDFCIAFFIGSQNLIGNESAAQSNGGRRHSMVFFLGCFHGFCAI